MPVSPQPATAPVHQLSASQDHGSEETVWKDFPPLQLPPVHLPVAVHPIRNASNGHQVPILPKITNIGLQIHSYLHLCKFKYL
jgi:hypothetical protein